MYTRYPIVVRALGLAALGRVRARAKESYISSIYMRASYEELRKIGKNWEKVSARSTGQQYFNSI